MKCSLKGKKGEVRQSQKKPIDRMGIYYVFSIPNSKEKAEKSASRSNAKVEKEKHVSAEKRKKKTGIAKRERIILKEIKARFPPSSVNRRC